ncbi:MAG TPA: hypothetical protein DDW94_12810 [Deltaproteobacteria bacterium]|nr:hypothetical protein [Deltaproteobacteria bacterium]HCY11886.1 hypothetical protein [Deltaproteobacteria bacterium]
MRDLLSSAGSRSMMAASNMAVRRYPLSVTFISTYRCNFRCEYCDIWRLRDDELSTDDAIRMIDEFSDMGMSRLCFTGGEPLTRDDIGELTSYSVRKGVFTSLFTNGSLLEDNMEKLKELDLIIVSLDGPEEAHGKLRDGGSYRQLASGIRAAKMAGLNVWTNTVITKENLDYLPLMVDDAQRLGVKMTFQPVLSYPFSSDVSRISSMSPEGKAYMKAIQGLKELKKKGAPIVNSPEYLDHIKLPVWGLNRRECWAGRLYCAVTPTGNVAPCYPAFYSKEWPSGALLGYREAFEKIGEVKCAGCYTELAESDLLYSSFLRSA